MEILKINSVANRGLAQIIQQHRQMPELFAALKEVGAITIYRGAFASALDTVVWYAYGGKPND